MEFARGLDQLWMLQLIAASKRLVAMGMWQAYNAANDVEAMIHALDQADWMIRPKTPHPTAISTTYLDTALTDDIVIYGQPIVSLIQPYSDQLQWKTNSNYHGTPFAKQYAYSELIGPDGIAISDNIRIGLLLMAPRTLYPFHHHPASEIYYVLSGEGRFRLPNQPARVCPSGQFVFHDTCVDHEIESRDSHLLALYFWRGDVLTPARLSESVS